MPLRVSRLSFKRSAAFSVAALLFIAAAFCLHVWRAAHAALDAGAEIAASSGRIPASVLLLRPSSSLFESVLTAADFRSAAEFQGDLYICGSSALFRYAQGQLKQTWRVGRDLPPYPLLSVAVRTGIGSPELWIATSGAGVVIYDGNAFRQLLPDRAALRKISAMLPLPNGRVLVGTPTAGLYIWDGKSLRVFHAQFAQTQITALAGDEDQLWLGTRADGAWQWRGGEAVHFARELPDPQVLSLAVRGENVWIGTALGVVEFSSGKLSRRLADGVFAQSLAEKDGTLWIGTMDQGVLAVPLSPRTPRPQSPNLANEIEGTNAFAEIGDAVATVSPNQVLELPSGQRLLSAPTGSLSGGHIAAIHEDSRGRLWIGYFDRGLDLVQLADSTRISHFDDDVLFCVNRIKENPQDGTMAVATANGLAIFDAAGTVRQVLDRESGLIASHVTDVLFRPDEGGGTSMAIATPAGLSFLERGSVSSMYAFQGLVNNHVYTLANLGGTLYAGTLGGISAVKNGLIQANFTTANSELRQNWTTASAVFGGKLYLGTYGSGVIRFEQDGGITSFPPFSGRRIEINPNAMLATGRALYAGTAGQGLAILRKDDERWQFVSDGLPSLNVTALDEHAGRLYVGTENGLVRISENNLLP